MTDAPHPLAEPLLPLATWDSAATWETFGNGTFHGVIAGVEIQKCADDLDRYNELIEISQPDLVIETGTRRGGSALWFRSMGLQVITIDLEDNAGDDAQRARPQDYNIHYIRGHSSVNLGADRMSAIQAICRGKRIMVSLDSDHHSAHVEQEIALWSRFVSPGCYLVVEDACFDMWIRDAPGQARVGGSRIPEEGGPLTAIQNSRGLLQRRAFWRDTELEGLTSISHSPCGWWRHDD